MIPFGPRTARFRVLTVFHQDAIASHFRIYVFAATAVVSMLYVVGAIPYPTFLWGMTIGGLAWCFIHARETALLNIRHPKLRATGP